MKKIIGIYYLKSVKKNFYYIGKSVDINRRRIRHYSELRNKKHSNLKLQRHFDKYGETDLIYGIFECLSYSNNDIESIKKELLRLEIEYIIKYDSFQNGFNLTKGGDGLGGLGRKFSLKNVKTKEEKEFNSISEATFFIGCSSASSIHAVLSGKCNTCKGWCRVDDVSREVRTGAYSDSFMLEHPVYGVYKGSNQSEFKRKFKINCDVSSLIKGKRKSCCGWRVKTNV